MILTDGTHLVSDLSVQELHRFAGVIGMPFKWFQDHRIPHYDLLGVKRRHTILALVRRVSTRELVRRAIRKSRSC